MARLVSFQKGNMLLITLLIVAALGVGGYYFYSKGKVNLNVMPLNNYMSPNPSLMDNASADTSADLSTSGKMTLVLNSPLNGAALTSGNVTVSGKTSPYAEVFVNDQSTKADAQGNFSLNLTLDEGSNNVVVTANDSEGNIVEQTLSVNVQTF